VVDVSNPLAPTTAAIRASPADDYAAGVAAAWPYAYVANYGAGLWAVRVNALPPQLADLIDTAGLAYDVALGSHYAYVADWDALRVIDVADPAHLSQAGAYTMTGHVVWSVAAAGSAVYLAEHSYGLHVIDVSDPAAPDEAAAVATAGEANGVTAAGNVVCMADGEGGLVIFGGQQRVFLPAVLRN
jgi:hypothetical protein